MRSTLGPQGFDLLPAEDAQQIVNRTKILPERISLNTVNTLVSLRNAVW
jgi:hypothetical protein